MLFKKSWCSWYIGTIIKMQNVRNKKMIIINRLVQPLQIHLDLSDNKYVGIIIKMRISLEF
jgi:hypothetical protein